MATTFSSLQIIDQSPKEFAAKLAAFEWQLFTQVATKEMKQFSQGLKEECDNILTTTRWFNNFSMAIVRDILKPDITQRSETLKWWIKVAKHCLELRNFNAVMEILAALGMHPISRLKLTWEKLPSKQYKQFYELEETMTSAENFKNYRKLIANELSSKKPVVPYLGVHLRDLVFIEENNENCVDGSPNKDKHTMMERTLAQVENFLNRLAPKATLESRAQLYFNSILQQSEMSDDDHPYRLSLKFEPTVEKVPVLTRHNSLKNLKNWVSQYLNK